MITTIQEDFSLPSKGLMYTTKFDPHVKLRSMTVADEMKRLQATERPYKVMTEIIDDCLVDKLPISSYDMCLGDYQYLLHKLRVVTYGSNYNLLMTCPFCGETFKHEIDLNTIAVHEFDEKDFESTIKTPSGLTVELRFTTPRDVDWISQRSKEIKKNFPELQGDPSFVLNLQTMIKTINGQPLDPVLAYDNLKTFPMADINMIIQKATELNEKVGLDTVFTAHCNKCDHDVTSLFRYTTEFFRPGVN